MQAVTIYTTPYCPYCVRAKMLLDERGVTELNEIRIDQDRELRKQMIERTGRRTVPQIYIGDHHVGGCDDLVALDREGKLEALLQG
ncbi:glutaredoxin 3 [Brachymonas sp. G13]|uniref:glutaredoxin 3 n=1 Tax=Brachymonas TaxID=28219 RepID=UPI0016AD0C44|nr:glutaredoxin 3 [Brachymonas sp. J145]MEE1653946.1 glutaredoxin 3 [Brachymonas sp. J145]NLX16506.1 glutaredoxin 3 [Ramlibacter sp.]